MNKDEFINLSSRVADGAATEEDYQTYSKVYNGFQKEDAVGNEISLLAQQKIKLAITERIDRQLKPVSTGGTRRLWYRLGIAAAVATIVLNVWLFYGDGKVDASKSIVQSSVISPAQNKAILTLSSGKEVDLTALHAGEKVNMENISVVKKDDGTLLYTLAEAEASAPVTYNTFSTPRGGFVDVNLPDGTVIFLNTATRIRVPSNLTSDRRVELLEGEAYFDVAHDASKPFRIVSKGQKIEVLGTKFNINSYLEEDYVRTTLEEGLVRVSNNQGQALVIKPGQQAINSKKNFTIKDVDVSNEIAWKEGMFSFEGQDFKTVMLAIGRWYDVEVVFERDVNDLHLSIQVARTISIKELLKSMEMVGNVKFKLSGREVRVIK